METEFEECVSLVTIKYFARQKKLIFVNLKCEQPSGQLAVNESNLILCCELDRSSRVVLRINAKNIKILHPQTDKTLRSFKINMVSFAAQDENTESVFRSD